MYMEIEIKPEPTEEERTAIGKVLAEEAAEPELSAWEARILPVREP
jgi:hypothetical protein